MSRFALCIALFCSLVTGGAMRASAMPIARLRRVDPTVNLRNKGAKKWVVARERGAVQFGDEVKTGAKGKADILFANGTKVAMRANSSIEIIEPSNPNNPLIIRVFGALSEVFVRPRGNTQVRTAAAIAAARGTEFIVRLPDELSTQVIVSEGSVDFGNEQGQVLVQENQSSQAHVGQAPLPPVAVDVSGELAWTADITGLPLEWRTPFSTLDDIESARVLKAADTAARANPNDFAAQMRLGKATHDAGEYSNAAEIFTRLIEKQPNNAEIWTALSRAERGRGAGQQALAAAQRAQQIASDSSARNTALDAASAEAVEQIALSYLVIDDLQAVTRVLVPIRDTPRGQAISALVALREHRVEAAITDFRAALSSPSLQNDASLRSVLAMALLSRNETDAALIEARRAVRDAPRFAEANGVLASVLFFKGEPQEAANVAKRALQLDDESPLALLASGRLLLASGNEDEARENFSRAYALFPSPLTATEVGDSYLRLRQWHKAETFYRRALQRAPDYAPAQSGLGVSLQEQGQNAGAAEALQRARVLDPQKSLNRARLAQLYYEQGDLKRARQELPNDEELTATPENAILLVRLSELSLVREDLMAAQNFARRAVKLLPQSGLSHYQLGRVYLEQGRVSQAEQQFRQAVILDDELVEARFALGYTREQIESGRDISRPSSLLNSANLGGASRAFDLQNATSPGAEDRIQATLSNPTVARSATRAVGDTQIDGILGTAQQKNGNFSYLDESPNRRSLLGITAQHAEQGGALPNSDYSTNRVGISLGLKDRANDKGLLFLARVQANQTGLNSGVLSSFSTDARGSNVGQDVLFGGFLKSGRSSRTRFLFRANRSQAETRGLTNGSQSDEAISNINFELRHDWRWSRRNLLSVGAGLGRSKRNSDFLLSGIPNIFPNTTLQNSNFLRQETLYLRNEFQVNARLSAAVQLQRKSLRLNSAFNIKDAGLEAVESEDLNHSFTEPKLVLDYRLNSQSGLRLRVEKTVGDAAGFGLLTPSDLFVTPLPNLPQLALGGKSSKFDLEAYHTFGDASFMRLVFFHQNLNDAREPSTDGRSGERVERGQINGMRVAYEGTLNTQTTFFTNLDLVKARDKSLERDLAFIPRVRAEAGFQYLRSDGWFAQPSWFYSGSRIVPSEAGSARERRAGFNLFNFRIGKKQGLRATYFAEVINIFDKTFDILGVEQPGRSFRIGASKRF